MERTNPADWAADPARVGHEPGYTWNEPDGIMRCVHCGYGPCQSPNGHSLSAVAAASTQHACTRAHLQASRGPI